MKKRLSHSKSPIVTTDFTIDEIASRSGFRSSSHFSKKFKEEFQISPSKFRLTLTDK